MAGLSAYGAVVLLSPKTKSASAAAQDFRGAFVVGGVEAERLRRTAGRDQRLDDPAGRPGFLAARLQDDRNLERNGGQPKRVDRRANCSA